MKKMVFGFSNILITAMVVLTLVLVPALGAEQHDEETTDLQQEGSNTTNTGNDVDHNMKVDRLKKELEIEKLKNEIDKIQKERDKRQKEIDEDHDD